MTGRGEDEGGEEDGDDGRNGLDGVDDGGRGRMRGFALTLGEGLGAGAARRAYGVARGMSSRRDGSGEARAKVSEVMVLRGTAPVVNWAASEIGKLEDEEQVRHD